MKQFIRPFSEQGHYTEAHNLIFDYIMPRVSANAFKVLCLILRRTKGWGKRTDTIAYRQIKGGTGIKSDTTISKALKELLALGCVVCRSGSETFDSNTYALNLKFEIPISEIYEAYATPENEVTTPENGVSEAGFTTPENGVDNASSTPENGVAATPENEVTPTPENGDTKATYETSTNQNNKLDVVDKGGQKKSAATEDEIRDVVLEVLDETINYQFGSFSPNTRTLLNSFVRAAVYKNRTVDDVRLWRERLPHYLRADPEKFTAPTLHQLVSTFDRVLEFQPKARTLTLEELERQTAALQEKS